VYYYKRPKWQKWKMFLTKGLHNQVTAEGKKVEFFLHGEAAAPKELRRRLIARA